MSANKREWDLQLYDLLKRAPIDDDAGKFLVLTAGDPAKVTVYSDERGTALTQPATITNGALRFFTDRSVETVDIAVLTAAGVALFLKSVSWSQHRVDVTHEERGPQVLTLPIYGSATALLDSGFDLPERAIVRDVAVQIVTGATALLFDIGVSSDADGFADALACSDAGYHPPIIGTASDGGYGDLLTVHTTNGGDTGLKTFRPTTAADSIVTTAHTAAATAAKGYLFVMMDLPPR